MLWLPVPNKWWQRNNCLWSNHRVINLPALLRSVFTVVILGSIGIFDGFGVSVCAQVDISAMGSSLNGKSANTAISPESKRYNEYRKFYYQNVAPLAKEAERKGIVVSQKEIDEETATMRRMYSEELVSGQMVTNQVLARKYAQTILNIKPAEHDKEQAYKQILAEFSDKDVPPEPELASLIGLRAIANCEVTKKELARISDFNEQLRVNYENENPEEMWSVEDLQIISNDDYCLARHRDSSNCQLSVRRFNALAKYQPFPKIVPLDTARQQAIRNILSDEYILIQARKNGFDRTDSAAEAIKGRLDWEAHDAKFRNLGTPVTDDGMLHIVYDQHYDVLFSSRKTPYYSIIGSVDSLYIDSLAKLLLTKKTAKTVGKDSGSISALPWSRSSGIIVSSAFSPFLDSLKRGEVSKPIRTPFGHFLARLDSISVRDEVPFEDATETLVLLATKKKWKNFDSAITANAFFIYTSAKSSYSTKDTLTLAFFLHPGSQTDSSIVTRKKETKWGDEVQRMVAEKGMKLSSQHLPAEIFDSLQCQYSASKKKSRFFGPLISPYGVCYCKVLGVKLGNGSVPYAQVRKRLLDSLVTASVDSGEWTLYQKPDSVMNEVMLTRVYAPIFMEDDGSGNIEQTGGADSKAMQEKFDAIEAWVQKFKIRVP